MATIHIMHEDNTFEVWLNPDGTPDTGLCLGEGKTLHDAIEKARETMLDAGRQLDAARAGRRVLEQK